MRITRLFVVAALGLVAAAVAIGPVPAGASGGAGVEVSTGSNDAVSLQNKQNEPAVAIDPANPDLVVAGANDIIDLEACNAGTDNSCPFTQGVGVSGVYFSFDGGGSWHQPTYTGYSARGCLGTPGTSTDSCTPDRSGPIGTLPWYEEHGIASDGDPAVAFGPVPSSDGTFSWSNGSRLYYANLTSSMSSKRSDAGFKGVEAIGISRLDVPTDGLSSLPAKSDWQQPVVVTAGGGAATFADKEQVWADDAASSPHFGNSYLCFGDYVGGPSAGSNAVREIVGTSTDGGDTWKTQVVQKNTDASSGKLGLLSGTSGCTVRTDSHGVVYVFWLGFDQQTKQQGIYQTRSFDGGSTFERPRPLFASHHTGVLDPVQGRNVMDGIAGARDDLSNAPSVDIANNAPEGDTQNATASNRIVMAWSDGRDGLNHEHLLFTTSTDRGQHWTGPRRIEVTGDRPYYTATAISPDGTDVYVVYNAFTAPYQSTTSTPRPLIAVLLHADVSGGTVGDFSPAFDTRSSPGDARGATANALTDVFLGDYVYASATNGRVTAVWNDTRDAADCPAIDAYRQALQNGSKKSSPTKPAPQVDCPPQGSKVFGNSSIYGVSVVDPS
jgi:hypothetical protein